MQLFRKIVAALVVSLALLIVQQLYMNATGGSRAYAQTVSVDDVSGAAGQSISVPVRLSDSGGNLNSVNFHIDPTGANSSCLTPVSISAEAGLGSLTCGTQGAGLQCTVVGPDYPNNPVPDGQIATMVFSVANDPSNCPAATTIPLEHGLIDGFDPSPLCNVGSGNCTGSNGSVTIDPALAVELSHASATRDGAGLVHFVWQTATESGNAGFNLYVLVDGEEILVNPQLIPSHVIDSVVPEAYAFQSEIDGETFILEMVSIDGGSHLYGPFAIDDVSEENSPSPTIWLPIISQ